MLEFFLVTLPSQNLLICKVEKKKPPTPQPDVVSLGPLRLAMDALIVLQPNVHASQPFWPFMEPPLIPIPSESPLIPPIMLLGGSSLLRIFISSSMPCHSLLHGVYCFDNVVDGRNELLKFPLRDGTPNWCRAPPHGSPLSISPIIGNPFC